MEPPGFSVVWRNGQSRVGIETHMGHSQQAYDAECTALTRALESASRRQTAPGKGHDFHGRRGYYQADVLGGAWPGQMYALQARKHITVLRRDRLDITIEVRRCPAREGSRGTRGPMFAAGGLTPVGWNS